MTIVQHRPPDDALAAAVRRRARLFRGARIGLLALVVGYFFLPYGVRTWIPPLLPFLLALALEAQFFVGGYRRSRRGGRAGPPDRGPQERDIAELGGRHWREVLAVDVEGERRLVPTEGLTDEEVEERVEAYRLDPDATLAEIEREAGPPLPARRWWGPSLLEAVVALAIVAVILVAASRPHGWDAVSETDRARTEARLSREATRIAGHPAEISCDAAGTSVGVVQEADGVAFVGGRHAYLTPAICDALYQLAAKHRVQSFSRTGRAIAVLAHEAWHLHGVRDEGLANCYAFQSGVEVGVRLGLSPEKARALMREQLATNADDATGHPEYLVPPGCHDGGADDLHPNDSGFP